MSKLYQSFTGTGTVTTDELPNEKIKRKGVDFKDLVRRKVGELFVFILHIQRMLDELLKSARAAVEIRLPRDEKVMRYTLRLIMS